MVGQRASEVDAFLREKLGNVWEIPTDGRIDFNFMKPNLIWNGGWKYEEIENFQKLQEDLVGSGGDFWIEDIFLDSIGNWENTKRYSLRRHKLGHQPEDSFDTAGFDQHTDALTEEWCARTDLVEHKKKKLSIYYITPTVFYSLL